MVQQEVRTLRLTTATLTTDHYALVPTAAQHLLVRRICDGENMRRQFVQPPRLVEFHILWVVDGVELERVESDEDGVDVCVDVSAGEAGAQVAQQGVLGEVGKLAEVWVFSIPGLTHEAREVVPNDLRVHGEVLCP